MKTLAEVEQATRERAASERQYRRGVVELATTPGVSITAVASAAGISRKTLYAWIAAQDEHTQRRSGSMSDDSRTGSQECECIYDCADDSSTRCSLSGEWHVHPEWPCTVHPDAPGDR